MGFLMFIPLGVFIFFFTADFLVESVKADVDNTYSTGYISTSNSTYAGPFQIFHSDTNYITGIYLGVTKATTPTATTTLSICTELEPNNRTCNNPLFKRDFSPAEISAWPNSTTSQIFWDFATPNLINTSTSFCVIPNKPYYAIFNSGNTSLNIASRRSNYYDQNNPHPWQLEEFNGAITTASQIVTNQTSSKIYNGLYFLDTEYNPDCQATSTININVSESSGSSTATMPSTAATTCNVPEASSLTAITSCTAVNEEGVNYTTYYLPILAWFLVGGFILLVGWNLIKIMFHKYDRQ